MNQTKKYDESLRDAQIWASLYARLDDPINSLRKLELETVNPFLWDYYKSVDLKAAIYLKARDRFFIELVQERRERLLHLNYVLQGAHKGRVLICDCDCSMCDGLARDCSEGFIDVEDLPPLDTWFFYQSVKDSNTDRVIASVIYAWIPEVFIPLAEEGIHCNTSRSLQWIEDSDWMFKNRVWFGVA